MTRWLIALSASALAFTLFTSTSHAGSCGGGGDDSDDSDSGWSSSDDDDDDYDYDDSDSDSTPSCDNSTVIHGRAGCKQFGTYNASWRPRLQFTMGTSRHRVSLAGMADARGTAEHDQNHTYVVDGPDVTPSGVVAAQTFDMRLSNQITRRIYVGVQGSVGASVVDEERSLQYENLRLVPENGAHLTFGGFVGAGYTTRKYSVRGEVEFGRQYTSVSITSYIDDCIDTSTVAQSVRYIRPRVIAEFWMTPWVTMGATLASNATQRGEYSAGMHMGFHLRGWDGALGR